MKFLFLAIFFIPQISFARVYEHKEWMEEFEKKDLNSQVELLKVQTARAQINEELGRILPSINIETMVNTAISGPLGLLTGMTNLLGFMLPSRWYQWNESKMYYQAQKHAYISMRGNFMLMADELYLSLKKAYLTREIVQKTIAELNHLSKSIHFRERVGELSKGTYARIEAKLYSLENDKINIDSIINLFLIEMNKLISKGDEQEITGINYYQPRESTYLEWTKEVVVENSSELKSLENLIVASRYSRRARFWSFLDISGEGFGLGYFARNKISTYKRDEIKLKQEQQYQLLISNFKSVNAKAVKVEKQNSLLINAISSVENRREQILIDYKLLGTIDVDDYIETLENSLIFESQSIATRAEGEYLNATKERLTRTGLYDNLDFHVPQRETNRLRRYQRKEDRYLP